MMKSSSRIDPWGTPEVNPTLDGCNSPMTTSKNMPVGKDSNKPLNQSQVSTNMTLVVLKALAILVVWVSKISIHDNLIRKMTMVPIKIIT